MVPRNKITWVFFVGGPGTTVAAERRNTTRQKGQNAGPQNMVAPRALQLISCALTDDARATTKQTAGRWRTFSDTQHIHYFFVVCLPDGTRKTLQYPTEHTLLLILRGTILNTW